jgi:ribosome-binding factor A
MGVFVLNKRNRKDLLTPEYVDFIDALESEDNERGGIGRHAEHKVRQLCRQVQRAINLALAERSDDPLLDQVYVDEVTPAHGCGHLLVHFIMPVDRQLGDVLTSLRREAPRFRVHVARTISRKQAPELSFVPVNQGGVSNV